MRLRSIRFYRSRGETRTIRLYQSWRNMRNRVRGTTRAGNGTNLWAGLTIEWPTFEDFRAWALANGYCRRFNSLDREREAEGYGPGNCRWVTRAVNTANQNEAMRRRVDPLGMGGRSTSYNGADCPF
jgi:hypothetical protein